MHININLDATAVNSQVKMNFTNDPVFGGNPLLTPVGRLEVLSSPGNYNARPTLGGMQQGIGAFMFNPASGTGQFMLEDGSFTFNCDHEGIMEGTADHLVKTLTKALKVKENTVVSVIPFGKVSVIGTDVHVRFVVSPDRAVEFEKFPSGWRVWDVTTQAWEQFMVVFDLDGVFSMNEPPKFVTLHLSHGDVIIHLDKNGHVTDINVPENESKFAIHSGNEIFQYLRTARY